MVRNFYEKTTYKNILSIRAEDEIVAAYENDEIVGLFRICVEKGTYVLRGFFVLKEYQRKGIGSMMMKVFENELSGRICYLICRKVLNGFYRKMGFEISDEDIPDFLIKRKEGYNNRELNILVKK
jgi:GNAT superfamily N-acetyltransferase